MSATAATAKKQKPLKRHPSKLKQASAYTILTLILISIVAVTFAFPLYWIITGSFKTGAAINSTTPEWWPHEWVLTNYQKLFAGKSAPLWQLAIPFSARFSADGDPIYFSVGPTAPAALRWMINTVFMAVVSMILTCITAAMAGYALAKKRFVGRQLLFTLIVCAMALPKQVILIPLLREMSALNLYNTIWAVIFPIVGWPFGVFLMKQFSEGIPTEMLEAARIDGASEAKTFISIVLPMVKPGIGALAIFTFINSWNDYFMQLIMLSSTSNLTISLGIAKLQAENSTDFGLIMAGAALAAVPIIIIFLIFQKYFTKGIAMGAVKGQNCDRRLRRKQGAIFGAAVCKTRDPPKGRSGCRAPQEGIDAVARNRKRWSLMFRKQFLAQRSARRKARTKGRSGCRAPQEGADAVNRTNKHIGA